MVLLYCLATLLLLHLFSPSRYVRLPLPIFMSILVTIGIDEAFHVIRGRKTQVLAGLLLLFFSITIWGPLVQNDYRKTRDPKPYLQLTKLPSDAVIAAFPFTADNIPILSKRSAYASDESGLRRNRSPPTVRRCGK